MSPTMNTRRNGQLTRGGFTLTEMLVAVGAMALLSLGVAQIFALTTKTVAAGRRLSNLNSVASATERQLRADFAGMTSRGVLVIRNELANGGNNVDSYPADPSPRKHRIDEIMFAATGHFTSSQQPVTVGGTPVSSTEALIYIGHGARQEPTAGTSSGFNNPVSISDPNTAAPPLGVNQGAGGSKVNLYASEWTLARRAFVLSAPSVQTQGTIPAGQGLPPGNIQNSAVQIDGLPAVPSPNRIDAMTWASESLANARLRNGIPALSSGVVDIIAMDLRAMAGQLNDLNRGGNAGNPAYIVMDSQQNYSGTGAGATTMRLQQAWMRGIMPADSDSGRRMRVETSVPDFLNMNGGAVSPYQRSDQLMLTSGAFLPRCSDFIVEYSFGKVATVGGGTVGNVFWHGLNRTIGYNADTVERYADWAVQPGHTAVSQLVTRRLMPGEIEPLKAYVTLQPALVEPTSVPAWLTGSPWNYGGPASATSYAFFGLNDPLYTPINGPSPWLAKDVNGNGNYDWADGDQLAYPESIPWKRPTMIRITLTLCDPTDPTIEQTFQFIFDLPRDDRSPTM